MNKKCPFLPYLTALFSTSLIVLIALLIREKELKTTYGESKNESTDTVPIRENLLNTQSRIATERENKLRGLNTEPKQIVKEDAVTTTTKKTTTTTTTTNSDSSSKSS